MVDEDLGAAKLNFEQQSLQLRIREEALRRKDLELQDALLQIIPLLEENQAKKVTAEKRALEAEKGRELKESELEDALVALDAARASQEGLVEALSKLQQYKNYLSAFQVAYSDDFVDLQAITNRNSTLNAAHSSLLEESARLTARVDEARKVLAKAQKLRATHTLTAENTMARLKARLEAARAEVLQLGARVEEGVAANGKRSLQFGQMLRSVANLYRRCLGAPGGGDIRHSISDAEVLGQGVSELFAEALARSLAAGSPGEVSVASDAIAALSSAMGAMEGAAAAAEGGEGGAGGAPPAEEAAAPPATGAAATARHSRALAGTGRATLGRAPVFLAQAPPAYFAQTKKLQQAREQAAAEKGGLPAASASASASAAAAAGSPGGREDKDAKLGMDPAVVVGNLRSALGLLGCVGSYLVDFEDTVEGYAAHLAKEASALSEKRQAAAAEAAKAAEAQALKAAFAAAQAAKRSKAAGGGGGGEGGPAAAPAAALGTAAVPPKRSSRPPTSPLASGGGVGASRVGKSGGGVVGVSGAALGMSGTGLGVSRTVLSKTVATGGGVGGGGGDADAATLGGLVSAEALRRKRELEKMGLKTYFAFSPLPPPEGVVVGGGERRGGGGAGAGGAKAKLGGNSISMGGSAALGISANTG